MLRRSDMNNVSVLTWQARIRLDGGIADSYAAHAAQRIGQLPLCEQPLAVYAVEYFAFAMHPYSTESE